MKELELYKDYPYKQLAELSYDNKLSEENHGPEIIGENFLVFKNDIDIYSFILISATAVDYYYRLIFKYTG